MLVIFGVGFGHLFPEKFPQCTGSTLDQFVIPKFMGSAETYGAKEKSMYRDRTNPSKAINPFITPLINYFKIIYYYFYSTLLIKYIHITN